MSKRIMTSCLGCKYNQGWEMYIGSNKTLGNLRPDSPCVACYEWAIPTSPREYYTKANQEEEDDNNYAGENYTDD